MTTNTSVEVFLGNPITIASEKQFIARLRRDLLKHGVSARILANLQLGHAARQVDFVIVTEHRTAQVELKTFPGPIVAAPKHGDWQVRVGAADVRDFGNPAWQAQQATYAISDELHAFAAGGSAPGPSRDKFFRDIDTVVCAFPALHGGSLVGELPFVTVLGYADLLERLLQPGRQVPWSGSDWDAFGRRLNLYRADEDSPEGVVRRAGAAAVDAYRGLFLRAHAELPPLVETAVLVGDVPAPRPDLAGELTLGRAVLVHGPSEFGKTLWARTAAAELAQAGQVPIWLVASVCEDSFRTSLARAISPFTSLSPDELLRAAEAAGRAVAFIVDDLVKAPDAVRQALLAGAQAVRLRNRTCGLLITTQTADVAAWIPDALSVELLAPADPERRALLDAYGAPEIIDHCDAFVSPLELSLAAACAGALAPGASAAELLDMHIDRLVGGDDRLRGGLRAVARVMHASVMPSLRRPELTRSLRRDHDIGDTELQALWSCPILTLEHGRVSFRHERFEHFLAAESLLIDTADAQSLARVLNTPRCAVLRADAVALEGDERRLGEMLSACQYADLLVAAAIGRLGPRAARVTEIVLLDALNVACAQTRADGVTFDGSTEFPFGGNWTVPGARGPAMQAQMTTIGRLLAHGRFVEPVARLLDHTDALCARRLKEAEPTSSVLADRMFAATYALGGRHALPATTLVRGATHEAMLNRAIRPGAVAVELLQRQEDRGLGTLYVAAEFLRPPGAPPIVADVIVRCLKARRYHLLLLGLQLAELSAHSLNESARERVLEAVRALPNDNIMLNSSIIEALSALGDLTPERDVDDITAEIHAVLRMQDDPLGARMAYGIVTSQFETDAIGPYYEAVHALSDRDRERLLAIALGGDDVGWLTIGWILGEIEDLADPYTRAAVINYVARANPSNWLSAQWGMQAVVRALRLLVDAGVPLPDAVDGGSTDPAWRASLTVIMGTLASVGDEPNDLQAQDAPWVALLDEHRDVLASLLLNLRQMRNLSDDAEDVHELVLAAMPAAGMDVLIWSLEHPDRTRSLCQHDHGVRDYVIDLLGRIGDRRAADVLRRFVDEPGLGEAAAAAVRAIETRAMA